MKNSITLTMAQHACNMTIRQRSSFDKSAAGTVRHRCPRCICLLRKVRRRASLPSLHFSSGWDPSRRPLPRAFSLGLWRVSRLGLVHLIVSFALVRSHSDPARHRLWRPWGGWCRGSVHSRPSGRSFISPSRNPHLPSLRVNGRRHTYRLG